MKCCKYVAKFLSHCKQALTSLRHDNHLKKEKSYVTLINRTSWSWPKQVGPIPRLCYRLQICDAMARGAALRWTAL